jgi:glutaminase
MACEELGMDVVHEYVGSEPSGQAFNAFALTEQNPPLPFNPLINSGAITVCNLIGQKDKLSGGDRFDRVQQVVMSRDRRRRRRRRRRQQQQHHQQQHQQQS